MSGTSADGIDAALVEVSNGLPHFLQGHFVAHDHDIRQRLLSLAHAERAEVDELYRLDAELGEGFASASLVLLDSAGIVASDIIAIGSHGHTIRHRPNNSLPFTAQIGDPNRIAQRCGITTVADFRRRDVAARGEGAPLAPAMHQACLGSAEESRAILNLGGIANLSILSADGSSTLGFDTGPANCLMDAWIQRSQNQRCDINGQWAASGKPHPTLLDALLADPYFAQLPPKSTGREHFHLAWLQSKQASMEIAAEDVQATLLELTARSVHDALRQHAADCQRLLVCGGGVHNRTLMARLSVLLSELSVESTAAIGWDPDWIEATCFAWLASRTLAGQPGNLPAVTGADASVVLGAIHPG